MVSKGKAKRRRETNLRSVLSDSGKSKSLPPPPQSKDIHAVPANLRKIMEYKFSCRKETAGIEAKETKTSMPKIGERKMRTLNALGRDEVRGPLQLQQTSGVLDSSSKIAKIPEDCKVNAKVDVNSTGKGLKTKKNWENLAEEKQGKRSRKAMKVGDWRVTAGIDHNSELKNPVTKLNEKKRSYLERKSTKKKEQKLNGRINENVPNVRFGDVVHAPPKLSSKPRGKHAIDGCGPGMKTQLAHHWPEALGIQAASKERIRQMAVEAYRKKREWASRPGSAALPSELHELT